MKTPLKILAIAGLSAICMTAHSYELTDQRARAIVVADVLTAKCAAVYPSDTYTRYRKAASRLLSVATVNTDMYGDRYRQLNDITSNFSSDKLKSDCMEFIPKIADMIPEMERDYVAYLDLLDADQRKQASAWSEALELFASFATSVGQAAQSYNYQSIPMPSGRVNFGQGIGNRSSHYLVNTPGGTRQCYVARSRYISCN